MKLFAMKKWSKMILSFSLGLFMAGIPKPATALYEAGNDYNLYGHLYQYDVPLIGSNACCPTSAINSFSYLQNRYPAVYGSRLASNPPTIGDVQGIAGLNYMNTDKDNGTTDPLVIWGRYLFIESRLPFQTKYSCQVATRDGQPVSGDTPVPWPANRPLPRFLDNTPGSVSVPTWQFLYQNLQKGADLGLAIAYVETNGLVTGGHCLTLRRFFFDDKNNNLRIDPGEGSISLIDPAKKTEATYSIWHNSDSGFLNGDPYLLIGIDSKTALLELVLAKYPEPQPVPDTVETGNILMLGASTPYGILTFQGGVLYAVDPQTTWNKAMILGSEGGIVDSATNHLTLAGVISGPGSVNKWGSGTLFLRGVNSYAGGTILSEGVVNIIQDANVGNPAGSMSFRGGTLQAGAALTSFRPMILESVTSTTGVEGSSGFDTGIYHSIFSGTMTGPGHLKQTGHGSLTLRGNGSAYTGDYTIVSGTLILEGTLGNTGIGVMTINQNGTLKGPGILAKPNLTNYGTVNPGNSVGTLTVEGGYYQKADGRLEVEIASATSYDRLRIKGDYLGAAGLDGILRPVVLAGYHPPANTVFTGIITADRGVYNTFAIIENNTPIRTWQALYSPDRVDLTLTRDYAKPSLGLNSNQHAVGAMFNAVADTTSSGDLAKVLNALDDLPTVSAVADAYQQIMPEKAGALPALSLAGSMMQWRSLSNRLNGRRWTRGSFPSLAWDDFGSFNLSYSRLEGLMLSYNASDLGSLVSGAPPESGDYGQWRIFTDFVSTSGSQDSSTSQTGYKFDIFGFIGGADYRLRDELLFGVGSGYYHTSASYHGSGGSAEVNSIPLFAYAAYTPGAFYAMGALGYTLNLYDLKRNVTFGGVNRTANGSVNGSQFNAGLETGYDFNFTKVILTPSATLFYTRTWVGGFTETGADSVNLNLHSQSADSLQSIVGVRVSSLFKTKKAIVMPQVTAFYKHEFANNSRELDARLVQSGNTFGVRTDSPGRDFAVLGAGLALNLEKNVSLQANYNVELGSGSYTAHFLSAGLRLEF